jgi:cytoskeleton protein RodZ
MKDEAVPATLWPDEVHEARSMSGFGERMQREREMRSISLEEIAESTKIGCRMLRALEEEDFDKLPGGIFNKGFVRAYAKFLGIDEEQAVADFQAAFIEKQQQHPTNGSNGLHHGEILPDVQAMATEAPEQPDQAAGFMRATIIIICLLGIGGLGWKYLRPKSTTEPAPTTQAPAPAANVPINPPVQVTTPPEKAKPLEAPVSDTSTANPTAGSVAAAPAQPAPDPDAPIRLQIHAKETSWVRVTADEKVLLSAEIPAGQNRSFGASKAMVVKLGNAPGVELSYNGKSMPSFPADPKTRTLTFTPDGILQ